MPTLLGRRHSPRRPRAPPRRGSPGDWRACRPPDPLEPVESRAPERRGAPAFSDRRGERAEDQTRHDLNSDECDERREVDTAEEGHRAPDRRQDRLADPEDEVAETERQTRVRDPREDDADEDRQRQSGGEHVDEGLDEDDQEAGGAHSRYTSSRYRDGVGPVCP